VIDLGSGLSGGGFSLVSSLLGLMAVGVYALLQKGTSNDDDDSGPGGGLMQPVA
jgi:hypothetical protein